MSFLLLLLMVSIFSPKCGRWLLEPICFHLWHIQLEQTKINFDPVVLLILLSLLLLLLLFFLLVVVLFILVFLFLLLLLFLVAVLGGVALSRYVTWRC